jgi:hypothetical protein
MKKMLMISKNAIPSGEQCVRANKEFRVRERWREEKS